MTKQSKWLTTQYEDMDKSRDIVETMKAMPREELFRQIVAYAGFDLVEAGAALRQAIDVMVDEMSAEKVSYFQKDGMVTDERVDKDSNVRLKAARMIHDFVGDVFGDKKDASSSAPSININVNGWFTDDNAPKDVTP